MKTAVLLATIATFVTAGLATSLAFATTTKHAAAAPRTLKIVMHDPGCHWFQIGTRFTKTATVNGTVRLFNFDEAALKVLARNGGLRRIAVGKSILVYRGNYGITMVGQAPDDNHLKLTVR